MLIGIVRTKGSDFRGRGEMATSLNGGKAVVFFVEQPEGRSVGERPPSRQAPWRQKSQPLVWRKGTGVGWGGGGLRKRRGSGMWTVSLRPEIDVCGLKQYWKFCASQGV